MNSENKNTDDMCYFPPNKRRKGNDDLEFCYTEGAQNPYELDFENLTDIFM